MDMGLREVERGAYSYVILFLKVLVTAKGFYMNSNPSEVSFIAAGHWGTDCFPQTRKGLPIKVGLFTELEQVC